MRGRREMFAIAGSQIEAERQRLVAKGYLGPVQAAVMRRGQLHAETEVRWHDEFAKLLGELPSGEAFADQGWGPRPGTGGRGAGPAAASGPDGDPAANGAPLLNMVMVPLLLLSGIMLPMTLGPGWLQGIARATPFRYITDAMREAYAGHYANTIMVEGIAVALGLAALCLWIASRVFVRENA
jgi:ABC-2 type transporter